MNDNNFGWNEEFEPDYDEDYGPNFPPDFGPNFRNRRYHNAYGDYRGGYGPPGGFGGDMGPLGPPGPPGPPLGFGPPPGPRSVYMRGNPGAWRRSHEDKAWHYLLRCGMMPALVKSLPRQFLRLIEPEYCGVCSQELSSFAASRLHYISRNHLKNQKRWLSQKANLGKNEKPLRSRDLYCELCDVEITSKAHATSHYAGKPHRAIVEGRKNPKNVMLMQPEMDARLQQLIRREKKFLKEGYVEEPDPAEEEKKDAKPISPELYCNICKTSVTCTEQMTIHLNGKRHLAKEKQHILQMMTAQPPKKEEETPKKEKTDDIFTEEDEVAAGTSAENTNEDTEDKVVQDDWGHGVEAWEELAPEKEKE